MRQILLRLLDDAVEDLHLVEAFLRHEHFADLRDYLLALSSVWGSETAFAFLRSLRAHGGTFTYSTETEPDERFGEVPDGFSFTGFLLEIPEPDFLTAIELGTGRAPNPYDQAGRLGTRINSAFEARGVPYRIEGIGTGRFRWTGDVVVQEQALGPALSALDDRRLARGPKHHFDAALGELRKGTPNALTQAVAEACHAVESALKVLLVERGQPLPKRQSLDALMGACKEAGLFPLAVDGKSTPIELVLTGPGRFGNKRGRHGPGVATHDVRPDEAEAVVAAAAVAITFIARQLP